MLIFDIDVDIDVDVYIDSDSDVAICLKRYEWIDWYCSLIDLVSFTFRLSWTCRTTKRRSGRGGAWHSKRLARQSHRPPKAANIQYLRWEMDENGAGEKSQCRSQTVKLHPELSIKMCIYLSLSLPLPKIIGLLIFYYVVPGNSSSLAPHCRRERYGHLDSSASLAPLQSMWVKQ